MSHHHTQHHHHNTSDDVSLLVHSPRFSGPVTRRAHSFKRSGNTQNTAGSNNSGAGNNGNGNSLSVHHEIDLQLNSPRSEGRPNSVSADGLSQRVHGGVVKSLLRKPGVGSMVFELGLRETRKLRHWMFFAFCGVCLFLGVFKICATWWLGSTIESVASNQVLTQSSSQTLQELEYVFLLLLGIDCVLNGVELLLHHTVINTRMKKM
ncbi:hypothetical protein SLEP1_g59831 [Rubroshorea leprosula]|uniref:Uncharacterized protein n=1 Tax=Rubroshorea leprosula TaxID=152421 RepID=A0AAV5MW15_9ROSI|nr:hypothetical protein SLEP1_g59831 [Rubroshorea leprosula]